MKKITLFIVTTSFLLLVWSCNQAPVKQVEKKMEKSKTIAYASVQEIINQGDKLANKTVHVQGIIEHVCKHGWRRFKIIDNGGVTELKIELDEKFAVVDPSIVGSHVKATGKLIPIHMDAENVLEWKKKMQDNHKGEENTKHYKEELALIQGIYKQIMDGEITHYTTYSIEADEYILE